jgi:hypothetical protein
MKLFSTIFLLGLIATLLSLGVFVHPKAQDSRECVGFGTNPIATPAVCVHPSNSIARGQPASYVTSYSAGTYGVWHYAGATDVQMASFLEDWLIYVVVISLVAVTLSRLQLQKNTEGRHSRLAKS